MLFLNSIAVKRQQPIARSGNLLCLLSFPRSFLSLYLLSFLRLYLRSFQRSFHPSHRRSWLNFFLRAIPGLCVLPLLLWSGPGQADDAVLRIGSKRFTESYILGEILRQTAAPFDKAEHRQGLGNTAVVLAA